MQLNEWRDKLEALQCKYPIANFDDYSDIDAVEQVISSPADEVLKAINEALTELADIPMKELIPKCLLLKNFDIFHRPTNENERTHIDNLLNRIEDIGERDVFRHTLHCIWKIPTMHDRELELENKRKKLNMDINFPKLPNNLNKVNIQGYNNADTGDAIQMNEIILVFQMRSSYDINIIQQEIDVLGCQSLLDLGDALYCIHSVLQSKGNQSNPWFFIEGYFYMHPQANDIDIQAVKSMFYWIDSHKDNSTIYIKNKHMKQFDLNLSILKTTGSVDDRIRSQLDYRFDEMKLQLGCRYLYCHESGCEHFIYLTDVRRYDISVDLPFIQNYPRVREQSRSLRRRRCSVCDILTAQYIVNNDRLAAMNPIFYCIQCYHAMHYSADGRLIYNDFVVHDYLHDMN